MLAIQGSYSLDTTSALNQMGTLYISPLIKLGIPVHHYPKTIVPTFNYLCATHTVY